MQWGFPISKAIFVCLVAVFRYAPLVPTTNHVPAVHAIPSSRESHHQPLTTSCQKHRNCWLAYKSCPNLITVSSWSSATIQVLVLRFFHFHNKHLTYFRANIILSDSAGCSVAAVAAVGPQAAQRNDMLGRMKVHQKKKTYCCDLSIRWPLRKLWFSPLLDCKAPEPPPSQHAFPVEVIKALAHSRSLSRLASRQVMV